VRRASLTVPGGRRQYTWCAEHARSTFELLKAMQAKNLKRVALELAKPCKTQASKRRRTRRYARRRADEQLRHKTTVSIMERPARKNRQCSEHGAVNCQARREKTDLR
jgi:hypothetical protein